MRVSKFFLGIITLLSPASVHNQIAADASGVVADRPVWLQEAYDWAKNMDDFLSLDPLSRRLQAMDACQIDAMRNEEAVPQFQCECQESDAGVRLVCIPSCAYCNNETTSCGIRSAQALYDVNGTRIALGGVIQYTTGCNAGDVLSVQQTGCTATGDCTGCSVFANEEQCNSCILRTCPNSNELRELIDCENIEEGATFDLCDPVQVDTGIFEAFSTTEYEVCLDPSLLELSSLDSRNNGKGGKGSKSSKSRGKGGSADDCPESSFSSSKSTKKRDPPYGKGGKGSKSKLVRHPTVAPVHPSSTKMPRSAAPTHSTTATPTHPTTATPTNTLVHPTHPPVRSPKSSSSSSSFKSFHSSYDSTYKKTKGRRRLNVNDMPVV